MGIDECKVLNKVCKAYNKIVNKTMISYEIRPNKHWNKSFYHIYNDRKSKTGISGVSAIKACYYERQLK